MKPVHASMAIALPAICATTLIASQNSAAVSPVTAVEGPTVLNGHRAGVTGVRFSPDGRWIASSSLDGTVRVWSWPSGKTVRVLPGGGELYDVAVSSDGKLIAAVGDSRNVMLWRSESGAIARKIQLPVRALSSVFIGKEQLAVGSSDGKIRLIDLATGRIEREISAGPEVFALGVSPDRRLLASGLPLAVWGISTVKRIATPRGFAEGDVVFSPDGKWLASGEYTGGGRLFTLPSADLVSRFATNAEKRVQGPKGASVLSVAMPVTAVTFSPDGGLLATAGGDRRI